MDKKILIVGGVAGGATAAARLRRLNENAKIIMFERGEYISYANCGLPYHIGNVIKSRNSLLLLTPEAMKAKYNVDVRIKQEVISIDRENKTVTVRPRDKAEYTESYDVLLLSTGSSPFRPSVPGIDSKQIMSLWTVPDTDRIKEYINEKNAKSAIIVGGGFIGLEMAENLKKEGLNVTVAEMLDQVMAPLDFEMAQLIHENLEQNGIDLVLGDAVDSFKDKDDHVEAVFKSGRILSSDLVILAIGVRPNSELAKNAGLAVNPKGGIIVNDHLKTSDPYIYAVGDVIEVEDYISKNRTMVPLAGPANKQGRIAADNIMGTDEKYEGTMGASVVKIFDLTVASTGSNEKTLIKQGLLKGKDYESVIITQNSHAGYYPGATPLTLKLLFSMDGKKIYGAQIVGRDGVDKRIDTISVVIRLNGSIHDLASLELAYAPPYSSAKDPVNMAGFVAENVITGKIVFTQWDAVEKCPDSILLDVREDAERMVYTLPRSTDIPLGVLREKLNTLDRNKEIIVFCSIGVRSYNAARILMGNGFKQIKVYPAGTRFYISTHYKENNMDKNTSQPIADSGTQEYPDISTAIRIDCSGLQCPGPIMKVFETLKELKDGQSIEVTANDPGFAKDIVAWCRRTGNTLVLNEKRGNDYVAVVKKGGVSTALPVKSNNDGKTIIVFDGDLDKVLAAFIIANGAAAMGRHVTMFFTFWGLNVLRKSNKQKVNKTFIESMFGVMMPRGVNKLKLSNMNMGGMGSKMIKMIMRKKNVDSLEVLMQKALKAGVKLIACTMSMDIMGIKAEELIDGVELGGVGTYLGDAEESNVNLFI